MNPAGYGILCTENPAVGGIYVASGPENRFFQRDGNHILARHPTGQWGIGDGKIYLFLTKTQAMAPSDPVVWLVLRDNRFFECPGPIISPLKSGDVPPVTTAAPPPAPRTGIADPLPDPYSAFLKDSLCLLVRRTTSVRRHRMPI
jgi:hypothetical protein